jgi:hypothetical protein
MHTTLTTNKRITRYNREAFKKYFQRVLNKQEGSLEPLTKITGSLLRATARRGFQAAWYKDHQRKTKIGIITMPRGTYVIGRNGNNIHQYNMFLYESRTNKIYFRTNIQQLLTLVEILGGERKQLPTLIHDELCDLNKKELLKRLSKED